MILSKGIAKFLTALEETKTKVIWDYHCRPAYDRVIESYRRQAARAGQKSFTGDEAFFLFEPIQGFIGSVSINSPRIAVGETIDENYKTKKICELDINEISLIDRACNGFIDEIQVTTFMQNGIKHLNVKTHFLISLRNLIKIKLGIIDVRQ